MQGDNGVNTVSAQSGLNDGVAGKADLVRQFASTGHNPDDGLIAQLTSNPFFTAVCQSASVCGRNILTIERALALPD